MIYLFHGSDSVVSKLRLERQVHKFVDKYGDSQVRYFSDPEEAMEPLATFLSHPSLFQEKKLAVIERQFSRKAQDKKQLMSLLGKKDPDTFVLILEESHLKNDHEIFSICPAENIFVSDQGPQSYAHIAQEYGAHLSPDAMHILAQIFPDDPISAKNAIAHAASHIFPETTITAAHISSHYHNTTSENAFGIAQLVLRKNYKKALAAIDHNIRQGDAAAMILGALAHQVRFTIIAQYAQQEKITDQTVSKEFKTKPYVITKKKQESGHYSPDQLFSYLSAIARADMRIKTGKQDGIAIFYDLIADIS